MTSASRRLDAATARKLAVEASCDPRTIQRAFAEQTVRGLAGERAQEVLVKHGLLAPKRER